MNSFNHYAYGAVGDWMFQNIGGLSAIEPGYKRSRIAPVPGGNPTEGAGAFDLKVTVPVNTVAEVHVPATTRWAVTEGRRPAAVGHAGLPAHLSLGKQGARREATSRPAV
ncbi:MULTISPECIES: alpha-L-rhamnosidase C-terminal domain-containing protein [Streptomyces]|uniref:alpha-L-rhamnosidase C-terminal domain-containing protein n=1 Tax=Streptomyces TaxID=1883 RepID=UPI0014877FEC|nr:MULTISPECIES: alpha-L-rhamnosidase C-terminal domain-containing protein [Streptomyces]